MRMSTVATGIVIATMSICTLLNIGCAKENTNEIVEANKPKQSISETYIDDRDTESIYIDDRDISNTYIDDRDVQNNHYEYSYDSSYFEEQDKVKELEEQIEELKRNQTNTEQSTIIKEEVNKIPEAYRATCAHCNREGEVYKNIIMWYDIDGNTVYTHSYCLKHYVDETGIIPGQDLSNLR